MVSEHLAIAERHVKEGARCVAAQSSVIERLRRHGLDTRQASHLLATMLELQGVFVADRDRLLKLARANQRIPTR